MLFNRGAQHFRRELNFPTQHVGHLNYEGLDAHNAV